MIRVSNYHGPNVVEGATYHLHRKVISDWIEEGRLAIAEDNSLIVGFELNASGLNSFFFGRPKSFNEYERHIRNIDFKGGSVKTMDLPSFSVPHIIIRSVGQGNWNEIHDGKIRLVYDAGTAWTATHKQVQALVATRSQQYEDDRPGFVLSHWDVDHYHLLLGMSIATAQSFKYFVCRGKLPNLTSRRAMAMISNVIALPPEPRSAGKPRLHLLHQTGDVMLFNSERHRDRNQSGLVIAVNRKASSAVLAGDQHYTQISTCVLPHLSPLGCHNLVVPHHGGAAGKIVYSGTTASLGIAAVSVGHNSYGHPNPGTLKKLTALGFQVERTDVNHGDISIPLP